MLPTSTVQQALLQARRDNVDVVVSFGGGSCADLGKAVCFFLEQESGMPGATHVAGSGQVVDGFGTYLVEDPLHGVAVGDVGSAAGPVDGKHVVALVLEVPGEVAAYEPGGAGDHRSHRSESRRLSPTAPTPARRRRRAHRPCVPRRTSGGSSSRRR